MDITSEEECPYIHACVLTWDEPDGHGEDIIEYEFHWVKVGK